MSKCENVVDNWEEIDEINLNTQLNQIKKDICGPVSTMPLQNGLPLVMMMQSHDEYASNYSDTNKSAVKILRRPPKQNSDLKIHEVRPKHPVKTLQQRELEYAEARLRILGSAKNPEDEMDTNIPIVASKTPETISSNFVSITYGDELSSISTFNNAIVKTSENILRMPKGPDGTIGFNIRR